MRPVCRLLKALYGHPDSGGIWERHCDQHLRDIGFAEVPSWRSVYYHEELRVLLVVYVDDFKMAGPLEGITEAWQLIRLKLRVEDPTPFGLFLGCRHEMGEVKLGPQRTDRANHDLQCRVISSGQCRVVSFFVAAGYAS